MDLCQAKLAKYIRQWGSAASIKLLESSCELFTHTGIQGVVGYRIEGKCAVVFGDPVASPEDKEKLILAFYEYCQKRRLDIVYVTISHEFIQWALHKAAYVVLEIGGELIIDPRIDLKQGSQGRVIRRKMNHAQSEGVKTFEMHEGDEITLKAIQEVIQTWLNARHGAQIYYTSIELFEEMEKKRWFYAQHQGRIVGVALLYYLESSGWVIHMLMTVPGAFCGIPEVLMTFIVEILHKEGCHSLSCGIVQAEELGEIIGLKKIGSRIARSLFKTAVRLFSLDGKRAFWKKFRPQDVRTFVAFSRKRVGIAELLAVKNTFNVSYTRKKKDKKSHSFLRSGFLMKFKRS